MLVDIVLAIVAFYLMIPLVAGYFAYSYGRSFWLWFAISTFLPVITHFILIALVYYDEETTAKTELNRRERAESERIVRELIEGMPEIGPVKPPAGTGSFNLRKRSL
ncbi:hypothetical protein [Fulvivirga sedimenti]|uniref:Uncharacterized protein n=1 Tax=Fulvivirga sedimenti TaxID=2879465 RepID=A0A9X1HR31_9BACT|nr:hypothetical protein [Fulvivirga sedimenti]MCA6074493.1 hypothetical protein [Fulvivirga sedimenti]MCA6075670.1 hypothetical protein [Fulvivirga sedimenti]MCA6076798.1 hypothetical protein [Fulvivirga sedimenti]